MDPSHSAQEVVRCALCRDAVAPMYCNVCHMHLCDGCVAKHLSDKFQVHTVVSLTQYLSSLQFPKCSDHPDKQCKLYCENCDCLICLHCVTSEKHKHHDLFNLKEIYQNKQELIRNDLQELEKLIYPKYQEAATYIPVQRADGSQHWQQLRSAVHKKIKVLHQAVDDIIQTRQEEIGDQATRYTTAIDKQEALQEGVINAAIKEIKQTIQELKNLLEAGDVCLVSGYKSSNDKLRKLPPKLKVTLSNIQPLEINTQLLKEFVYLSPLSVKTEEQGLAVPSPGAEALFPARLLLGVPRLITDIPCGDQDLCNVSCLSDEEIWTSGDNNILKLYDLDGVLRKSVQTKSGNMPQDIAVTQSGDLVYVDYWDSSINLVLTNDTQKQRIVKLSGKESSAKIQKLVYIGGWKPLNLCCMFSRELLVIMDSDDAKQTKVVRFSGFTPKQIIQWDDQNEPLYTSGYNTKYLSENRNLDIYVADRGAGAVVVVSAAGKLRFRYTGPPSTHHGSFIPREITTDSHGNILTTDQYSNSVHIIDEDGLFLRYIDIGLQYPVGLCVDSKDNLFVAEWETGKVKKLQYYK